MHALIERAINEFRSLDERTIMVVSHLDCDGLTSASIISRTLSRENKEFVLSIVKQIDEELLKKLAIEKYNTIIFTDLGSGYINLIEKYLNQKKVFIFDHHNPENIKEFPNLIHVNPHLAKIEDASSKISGSGTTYLFCKTLNPKNKDLSYLAVIGCIGDIQGFDGLNKEILEDAISEGKIIVKQGLKMFGSYTKPLTKLLQYSTDPYIPGVTGDEAGAYQFLSELGINFINEGKVKRVIDLNEQELKILTTGIILKRLGSEKNPEDIFGNIYILNQESDDDLKDAREFSTLLNCCGRLNKPSIGIGLCLNSSLFRDKAIELLKKYRLELIKGLNWFHANKSRFVQGKKFIIVNAENNIRDTLIGTTIGIVAKSNLYDNEFVIIGMAYTLDNHIKISMRACNHVDYDLSEILGEIVRGYGEAGGHKQACGASIPLEKEMEFLKRAEEVLNRKLY